MCFSSSSGFAAGLALEGPEFGAVGGVDAVNETAAILEGVGVNDEHAVDQHRRGGTAVIGGEALPRARPLFPALVIDRDDLGLLARRPGHVDRVSVHGRRRGGRVVVFVLVVFLEGARPVPGRLPRLRVDAEKLPVLALHHRQEDLVAPQHRRRMARARQLDDPLEVRRPEFRRHPLGVPDAGSVRSAEAVPLLCLRQCRSREEQKGGAR